MAGALADSTLYLQGPERNTYAVSAWATAKETVLRSGY